MLPFFYLIFALWQYPAGEKPPAPPPPDIVLIMADDMGFSDLGCYGGEISTPNLDALAEGGVRLTQFYNAARCCPTRASLLTGLYPHEAGMGRMVAQAGRERLPGSYQGYLSPDSCLTLAEALKPAGYRAYMAGKWHVGEAPEYWPHTRGFDRYFGLISGASSYFQLIKDQPRLRQMALDSMPWQPPAEGFYMTDAITDFAVERVKEHEQQRPDQPLFLYLAYTAPHWPLHALPEDIAKYEDQYDIGWDSLRTLRYRKQQELNLFHPQPALSPRPDDIPAWEKVEDREHWVRRMQVYAAMVDRMDQGIGQVLHALRETGRLDNTIVLFLSDNGACHENIAGRKLHDPDTPIGNKGSYVAYRRPWANAGNTPFRLYKSWVHEGGAATPLIVHWPEGNLPKGAIIRQPGHIIDIMPTLLEAAGATYPHTFKGTATKPLPGKSLLPFLKNDQQADRTLYWEHFGNAAIRQGEWKLVRESGQAWELYNLEEDRTELHDLAGKQLEKVEELQELYESWARKTGIHDLP